MSGEKTIIIKEFLRKECLPALAARSPYFSVGDIRAWLNAHKIASPSATLNRYLYKLAREGVVFDAGRGWYSRLEKAFPNNKRPVKRLVGVLERGFPLLDFTCWSTEQINPYKHHLLGKFTAFVFTDVDAMESVWEFLRDAGYDAYLNPTGNEKRRFSVRERTVVVRPSVKGALAEGHYAEIETLLVDLLLESQRLNLMDLSEFQDMARNLASSARILIGKLSAYANRREQTLQTVFGKTESIIYG